MKRKRIRLRYYDYRGTGIYFVTICTRGRRSTLGTILEDKMQLSRLGRLVASRWVSIPKHALNVDLDQFVVMPNHIHGLIGVDSSAIPSESKRRPGELRGDSLGAIVGGFKASVTRIGRAEGIVGTEPMWQRGFWEHIVRGPEALQRIRRYIAENPSRWYCDAENRYRRGDDPFDVWISEQGPYRDNR
jgi:REP element-mobilizing transposase RayT